MRDQKVLAKCTYCFCALNLCLPVLGLSQLGTCTKASSKFPMLAMQTRWHFSLAKSWDPAPGQRKPPFFHPIASRSTKVIQKQRPGNCVYTPFREDMPVTNYIPQGKEILITLHRNIIIIKIILLITH